MDDLTPDELNALCDIPADCYVFLAMQVQADALARQEGMPNLTAIDRAVLLCWYGLEDAERAAMVAYNSSGEGPDVPPG